MDVLRLADLTQLIDLPPGALPQRRRSVADAEGVRQASIRCLAAVKDEPSVAKMVSESSLHDRLKHAWLGWQGPHDRHERLAAELPALIEVSGPHSHGAGSGAADLHAQVNHLASAYARAIGQLDLSWLFAERALAFAAEADRPLLEAACAMNLGLVFTRLGSHWDALHLMARTVRSLPPVSSAGPAHRTVRGALHLAAAEAAAASHDERSCREFLEAAGALADLLGEERDDYFAVFGPDSVAVCEAECALRLGRLPQALRLIHDMEKPEALSPALRARHFGSMALAYAQKGDDAAAMFALLKLEEMGPEELRYEIHACEALTRLSHRPSPMIRHDLQRLVETASITL